MRHPRYRKHTMVTISETELQALLAGQEKAVNVKVTYRNTPRARKNPWLNLTKTQVYHGVAPYDYKAGISEAFNQEVKPTSGQGRHIAPCLVEYENGDVAIRMFVDREGKPEYSASNVTTALTRKQVEPYLYVRSEPPIPMKDFKLSNIDKIKVGTREYLITHSQKQ